jgi:uncharacterized protein
LPCRRSCRRPMPRRFKQVEPDPRTIMMTGKAAIIFALVPLLAAQTACKPRASADQERVAGLRAKANKGDAKAQSVLGTAYFHGQFGLNQDDAEALKWFRKAAEQNEPKGQYALGYCYRIGQGLPQNASEAVVWYRKATAQGYAPAQCDLGVCYAHGEGVAKEEGEAVAWFRMAANQNEPNAQCHLGYAYATGAGVEKDEAEAARWFRKAADQNLPKAQYNLAQCYLFGQGVAKDPVEAYKWALLGADQGIENAKKILAELSRDLSPKQMEEAGQRARQFRVAAAPPAGG